MRKNIEKLIASGITAHTVAAETGLPRNTVYRIFTGETKLSNVKFGTIEILNQYHLKEMEKMENIKQIIEGIENGTVEVENEESYEDINGAEYVSHFVEDHEDLEVLFEKREDANEVDPNELDDVYNYNKVVAYRINGGNIDWV